MLLFRLLLLLLPLLLLELVPGRGQRETEKTNFHFHFVGSAAHRRQNKWMTDVRDRGQRTADCVGNPFSSWPKERQTKWHRMRKRGRGRGRENQEMRLTFEQWARKGNEVLCGGPHVAPARGRSTRRMLNLNEVPTLLIAPPASTSVYLVAHGF